MTTTIPRPKPRCQACGAERVYALGLCTCCYGLAAGDYPSVPAPEPPPFVEPEGFSFA